jgi:hypothetical protein
VQQQLGRDHQEEGDQNGDDRDLEGVDQGAAQADLRAGRLLEDLAVGGEADPAVVVLERVADRRDERPEEVDRREEEHDAVADASEPPAAHSRFLGRVGGKGGDRPDRAHDSHREVLRWSSW